MANQFLRFSIVLVFCFLFVPSLVLAQDESPESKRDSKKAATTKKSDDGDTKDYVKQIEPGVKVFGVASRFAAVGSASAFDSSPDGRNLVFATSSKIKFFDLQENKITDSLGEPNEYYQHVKYSPDGRYVFAGGQARGKSVVRIFDAIDKSSVGTVTSEVEKAEPAEGKA